MGLEGEFTFIHQLNCKKKELSDRTCLCSFFTFKTDSWHCPQVGFRILVCAQNVHFELLNPITSANNKQLARTIGVYCVSFKSHHCLVRCSVTFIIIQNVKWIFLQTLRLSLRSKRTIEQFSITRICSARIVNIYTGYKKYIYIYKYISKIICRRKGDYSGSTVFTHRIYLVHK